MANACRSKLSVAAQHALQDRATPPACRDPSGVRWSDRQTSGASKNPSRAVAVAVTDKLFVNSDRFVTGKSLPGPDIERREPRGFSGWSAERRGYVPDVSRSISAKCVVGEIHHDRAIAAPR